ncbi:MAG TPA: endonuclease VII domain-containing protein, partial [Abditibacteriaceae bacterium]
MNQLDFLNIEEETKECLACAQRKPVSQFKRVNNTRNSDGLSHFCEDCLKTLDAKQLNNLYRKVAYARTRRPCNSYFLQRYGISRDEYDQKFELQQGKCAICGKGEKSKYQRGTTEEKLKALAVDHCHATGKVRGLLCSKCNRAIGLFDDDAMIIR